MEHLADAERIFRKALKMAEEKKDAISVQYIQEGLSKLTTRKEEKSQKIWASSLLKIQTSVLSSASMLDRLLIMIKNAGWLYMDFFFVIAKL